MRFPSMLTDKYLHSSSGISQQAVKKQNLLRNFIFPGGLSPLQAAKKEILMANNLDDKRDVNNKTISVVAILALVLLIGFVLVSAMNNDTRNVPPATGTTEESISTEPPLPAPAPAPSPSSGSIE